VSGRRAWLITGAAAATAAGCSSLVGIDDVTLWQSDAGPDAAAEGASESSVDAACTPGATQCSGNGVQTCGDGGSWGSPSACVDQTCVSGACTGMCAPGQTNALACGNCGTDTQTCSGGAWQSGGSCAGQGCAPDAMQACNTYGTQSCSTSCAWGSCSCASAPVCVPGATTCSAVDLQTCDPCGQWGAAVPCPSGKTCGGGVCTATPPSCQPGGRGMTDCGSAGDESCCTSLEVTAGTFDRTYDLGPDGGVAVPADGGAIDKADPASVSAFRLDKYEVTVGRFRQFVAAWNGGAGYTPMQSSGKHTHLNGGLGLADGPNVDAGQTYEPGWSTGDDGNIAPTNTNLACDASYATWTDSPAGVREDLPINCVNWWEAYAFCIWDGGFLPSECEWEYAAAGGSQQREYPWGATPPGTTSQYAIYGCFFPSGSGTCSNLSSIAPVGSAPQGAGASGQLDLAGNVWEWTLDYYAAYADPCTDCADVTSSASRVFRGGGFLIDAAGLIPSNRYGTPPASRIYGIGFRCARTP